MLENIFGILSTVTSIIGLIPQIYKSAITKSTADISVIMLINYLVCSASWIAYGMLTNSFFVVISNILGAITSIIAIIQKKIYG